MIVYREINGVKFGVKPKEGSGLLCTADVANVIDGDIYEFVELLYNKKCEYKPMIATWEVTNVCNFHCPFCYINTPSKTKNVTQNFHTMKTYIDELVEEGLLVVYLTGGEIMTVPDFEKIYRYLKEKGVFVVLLTNLSLLNEDYIELFKEYPPMRITTSIYGIKKNQFTKVTGQNSDLCDKILNNVLTLKEMGINITCQMPVTQETIEDLIEIGDWCYQNNIRFTFNNEITDSYYNEKRNKYYVSDEIFKEYSSKIKQISNEVLNKKYDVQKEFGYKHYFDCKSGKHTFAISYDTHLRPCFNIWETDDSYFDGSVSMKKAINEMKAYINYKNKIVIPGCKGCIAHEICGECKYTQLKHNDDLENYTRKKCLENKKVLDEFLNDFCEKRKERVL